MYFDQSHFDLRCEWGLAGLSGVGAGADAVVIVDVLSFTTAVDVVVSRGAAVYPYRWADDSAREFAAEKRALLAGKRGAAEAAYSLSPGSLRGIPAGSALVLPSPNGSSLSLHGAGRPTFAACLRNAPQVARRAALRGPRIAVIPAGERWPDGSLRPCLEDFVGAGAVLAALPGSRSPEAEMAIGAFAHYRQELRQAISRCASGRELIEMGFEEDVELATEYGVSATAPILVDGRFMDDRDAR